MSLHGRILQCAGKIFKVLNVENSNDITRHTADITWPWLVSAHSAFQHPSRMGSDRDNGVFHDIETCLLNAASHLLTDTDLRE
jgi:hypothetical protein